MQQTHKIITAAQPASCGEQPLTGLDAGNPVEGFTMALVFAAPLHERLLIESLQRALDQCPYFSGRLFGLGCTLPLVIPNNEGVLLTCASCDNTIPVFNLQRPLKPYISRFVHRIAASDFDHHTPLLQIRLTNFIDGSILGISVCHAFCDATSMIAFLRDWADIALGGSGAAAPCWNRRDVQQLAVGTGEHPSSGSPVIELERPFEAAAQCIETAIFHVGTTSLEQLHGTFGGDRTISCQDVAAAFIFLTMARCNTECADDLSLTFVCNVRRLLELPANFLGNAVCLRHFDLARAELEGADIGSIARKIRRTTAALSAQDLRHDLAFWQRKVAEGSAHRFMSVALHRALHGGILIDNMSKFDFYGLDFGAGKPVWIDTPAPSDPAAVSRGALMLPAEPARGGIDVHVSLPPEEMRRLEQSITLEQSL